MDCVTCCDGASGVLNIEFASAMMVVERKAGAEGWWESESMNPAKIYICDTLILNFNLTAQFSLNDALRDCGCNEIGNSVGVAVTSLLPFVARRIHELYLLCN